MFEVDGRASLYPYYAGFSYRWAVDTIEQEELPPGAVILDPYNGGGTTTTAAASSGHRAIGFDLNPVATTAAVARLIDPEAATELETAIIDRGCERQARPLGAQWLAPRSALEFGRAAQCLIDHVDAASPDGINTELRALARVILFRSLRKLTTQFEGSNPTWVRQPKDHQNRIRPSRELIIQTVQSEVVEAIEIVESNPISASRRAFVSIADSRGLPLRDDSADLVLTSPPYCTRIDYAVATSRELAALGLTEDNVDVLRRTLTGTTLNTRSRKIDDTELCAESRALLDAIGRHPSRDSRGYYHRQFSQYLADIAAASAEIVRTLKPGGRCVIVVQDSYYQDIPVRLGLIVQQELGKHGLTLESLEAMEVTRNLVTLNTRATTARSAATVSEFVLRLAKEKC